MPAAAAAPARGARTARTRRSRPPAAPVRAGRRRARPPPRHDRRRQRAADARPGADGSRPASASPQCTAPVKASSTPPQASVARCASSRGGVTARSAPPPASPAQQGRHAQVSGPLGGAASGGQAGAVRVSSVSMRAGSCHAPAAVAALDAMRPRRQASRLVRCLFQRAAAIGPVAAHGRTEKREVR